MSDLPHGDVAEPFWAGLRERRLMLQFDATSGRAQRKRHASATNLIARLS